MITYYFGVEYDFVFFGTLQFATNLVQNLNT